MTCASGRLRKFLHGYGVAPLNPEPQVFKRVVDVNSGTDKGAAPLSPELPSRLFPTARSYFFMKVGKIVLSLVFVTLTAVPAMAASDWVEEFLRRYDPSKSGEPAATTSSASIGQLLRTGELSVTLSDVINLMI